MTCDRYEVVVVPFPFTDRSTTRRRPALCLSSGKFSAQSGSTLLAMITSAKNAPWPLDREFNYEAAGLHKASKVRFKLFTLDNRLILRRLGVLHAKDRHLIEHALRELLAIV